MEERRKTTSVRQLELLIDFMDAHRDLALGRVRSKEARAVSARLWNECAEILNAEGPARNGKQWSKVWNDQKCKVRAKLVSINANHRATGGGPSTAATLSPLEDRIANIIGRDIGPIPNVRQNQFASNDGVSVEEIVIEHPSIPVDTDDATINASPSVLFVQFNEADNELRLQESDTVDPEVQGGGTLSPSFPSNAQPTPETQSPSGSPIRRRRGAVQARRAVRLQARTEHVIRRPTVQPPAQSGRSALDESRTMLLRIEEMRAEAALKMAEAAKLIAESIDRFSQKFCRGMDEN